MGNPAEETYRYPNQNSFYLTSSVYCSQERCQSVCEEISQNFSCAVPAKKGGTRKAITPLAVPQNMVSTEACIQA